MTQEEFTKLALEWRKENSSVLVTNRDAFNVSELAILWNYKYNMELYYVHDKPLTEILKEWKKEKEEKMNEEIKPIDWDSLPKVWAWQDDVALAELVCYMSNDGGESLPHLAIKKDITPKWYANISLTDPRPKKKTRLMTAEELNDIFWQVGKDFRLREDSKGLIFTTMDYHIDQEFSEFEYSMDRGVTWQKCEVEE